MFVWIILPILWLVCPSARKGRRALALDVFGRLSRMRQNQGLANQKACLKWGLRQKSVSPMNVHLTAYKKCPTPKPINPCLKVSSGS